MDNLVCKKCLESKPASLFHGRVCNECKLLDNKMRKISMKMKSKLDSVNPKNLTGADLIVYNLSLDLTAMMVSGNRGDKFSNALKTLSDIHDVIDQSNTENLAFKYDVSMSTKKFLQKVQDGDGDIGAAENMLRRNISNNRTGFLQTFEIDPETIDDLYDEVIKIKDSMDAVEAAYNIMVTRSNKNMSNIISYIDARGEDPRTKTPKASANFDLRKNEIVLDLTSYNTT